jgi:hypothetical protein
MVRMATIELAEQPAAEDLERFRAKLATLELHSGPEIQVHVVGALNPGAVLALAWQKESGKTQTETPSFSATGTVDQTFSALKQWLGSPI